MASGGYRIWATTDRHQADYTLRNVRKQLARAVAIGAPPEIIDICRASEARAIAEVERVEATRRCSLCLTQTEEPVREGSFGDYHESCMHDSLEMDEKLRRMA